MCQCVIFVQIDLRKGYDLIWRLYFDDLQDTIDCAKEDSFAEGVEHGIEKGRKRQIKMIKDLIVKGIDPDMIASALNMTPEQLIAFCTQ